MLLLSDIEPSYAKYIEPCPTTGCWLWTGAIDTNGYGIWLDYDLEGGPRLARRRPANTVCHRVLYEMAYGPVPEGLQVDHICMNASCINPSHLEAVTRAENMRRRRLMARAILGKELPEKYKTRKCQEGHTLPPRRRACPTCRRMADFKKFVAKYCKPVEVKKPVPWGQPVDRTGPQTTRTSDDAFGWPRRKK